MTLYILNSGDYDYQQTLGVFSTEQKAQDFIAVHAYGEDRNALDSPLIEEHEIDAAEIPTHWEVTFQKRSRAWPDHARPQLVRVSDEKLPKNQVNVRHFEWNGPAFSAKEAVQLGLAAYEQWLSKKPEWPNDYRFTVVD